MAKDCYKLLNWMGCIFYLIIIHEMCLIPLSQLYFTVHFSQAYINKLIQAISFLVMSSATTHLTLVFSHFLCLDSGVMGTEGMMEQGMVMF